MDLAAIEDQDLVSHVCVSLGLEEALDEGEFIENKVNRTF